jgi:hypothetical protein
VPTLGCRRDLGCATARAAIAPHPALRPLPRGGDYFSGLADRIEDYAAPVSLKAGEALLFDNSILHGSAPNRREETRLAIACQIVPQGAHNGLCLEGESGWIDFVEAPSAAAFDAFVRTGHRSGNWRCAGRTRNRNRSIAEAEFQALLASPLKASESFDPLDHVRGGGGMRARAGALVTGLKRVLRRRA